MKENKKMEEMEQKKSEKKSSEQSADLLQKKITELESDIVKLNDESNNWKNKYYKVYADIDNLRKSIEKDYAEIRKYRLESFIGKLIDVLDGFYLAINCKPDNEEMKNFLTGFQYVYNNLMKILSEEGVKEIFPKVGDNFDESSMYAVGSVFQEGEPNKIVKVNLKGYMLIDRLVRPAMVLVSTDKKETSKENDNNQKIEKGEK